MGILPYAWTGKGDMPHRLRTVTSVQQKNPFSTFAGKGYECSINRSVRLLLPLLHIVHEHLHAALALCGLVLVDDALACGFVELTASCICGFLCCCLVA